MLTGHRSGASVMWSFDRRMIMSPAGADIPYGTLDLMVLKTLDVMSPLNGYAIARRIEQKGWITSQWGTSDNNRRARFYEITKAGKKQLATETESWERTVEIMTRMLEH